MAAAPKEIIVKTWPASGWCMCNRVIYETSLKREFPDAKITHKMAMPLTVTVEADGKKGKTM